MDWFKDKYIYMYIYSKKMVSELHDWVEKQPHVFQYPNVSDSIFVKVNGIILKETEAHESNIST